MLQLLVPACSSLLFKVVCGLSIKHTWKPVTPACCSISVSINSSFGVSHGAGVNLQGVPLLEPGAYKDRNSAAQFFPPACSGLSMRDAVLFCFVFACTFILVILVKASMSIASFKYAARSFWCTGSPHVMCEAKTIQTSRLPKKMFAVCNLVGGQVWNKYNSVDPVLKSPTGAWFYTSVKQEMFKVVACHQF